MRTKTKISLRIDDDLLKVLKNNSTGNLTAYIGVGTEFGPYRAVSTFV